MLLLMREVPLYHLGVQLGLTALHRQVLQFDFPLGRAHSLECVLQRGVEAVQVCQALLLRDVTTATDMLAHEDELAARVAHVVGQHRWLGQSCSGRALGHGKHLTSGVSSKLSILA